MILCNETFVCVVLLVFHLTGSKLRLGQLQKRGCHPAAAEHTGNGIQFKGFPGYQIRLKLEITPR